MTQSNAFEHVCGAVGAGWATACLVTAEALPIVVQVLSIFVLLATLIYYIFKIRNERKKE